MKHWAYDSFFYHIYPLGFCGALYKNDFASAPVNRLEKLYHWTEHIKSLGVNAIYLGPLFESTYHGYDTMDYYHVDRRLGTNQLLKEIISDFNRNGIKIIFDGVFNHVGRDFWAFRDVISNKQTSRYAAWFSGIDFRKNNHFNDGFVYEGWNGHYDLVKLNLNNPEVKEHLFNAVRMWIEEFNISGLRLDAADCVDLSFLKELSRFTKKLKPDFWLMGEIIHGDYNKWVNPETLDSVTNYECYKGLYSSHNDKNFFEIAYTLKRQFGENGLYKGQPLYTFADNHDVNRISSTLKNPAHLYPLHCLMFTIPGVPSVYYGSEWGACGIKHNGSDFPLRRCIELHDADNEAHRDLQKTVKKLSTIRHSSPALKYGNYRELYVGHEQFAFMRQFESERIIIIINSSNKPASLELKIPFNSVNKGYDILNDAKEYSVSDGKIVIDPAFPCWAHIIKFSY